MSGYYPYFSKWLASQFQIIKDRNLRDVHTEKPIWSKIYPQQDNLPVYNKSGRYWVKLYYMGRERKMEIDDKMPTSVKNHCLLPRSVKKDEIWPMLLAKAIMKLNSLISDSSQIDLEFGDGSVIYSLTGLIPETMSIPKMINPDDWKYVSELLKDFHYLNNTAYVTCYCSSFYKPFAPSNRLNTEKEAIVQAITFENKMNPEEDHEQDTKITVKPQHKESLLKSPQLNNEPNLNKFARKTNQRKTQTSIEPSLHISIKSVLSKEKPTYVIPGFSYSILEAFYTEGFNMVFVQKHSDKEIKLIQDYLELSKINIHNKPKEEKLEIRRKRKELREKIHDDEKKRKELIEKPPSLYRFFRVKTAIAKVPVLNIMTPFTPDEIFLAKKCVINKLKNPPNYDLPEIKATADDKSVYSAQVSVGNQSENNQIIKALDDFSTVPNIKEPSKRGAGGTWILDKDFNTCFEFFQIFYNPVKLLHTKHINFQNSNDFELTNNENSEVVVIEENTENVDVNALFQGNKIPFIMTFSPNKAFNANIQPSPYCILQKFDFSNLEPVKNFKTLNQNIDSLHILLENKNHVFRVLTNSPLGYSLWFSCYNNFKNLSVSEYLLKYEGFSNKIFTCEYPNLEKDRYHLFIKYRLTNVDKDINILIRIRTSTEPYILKYLRYKLIELSAPQNHEISDGISFNLVEKSQENLDYNKFPLKSSMNYILLLESQFPFTVPEGNLELEILFKSNSLAIDALENLEPVEYSEKYTINKYGILFRERLFLNEEIQASFHFRLTSLIQKESNPKEMKSNKKPGNIQEADSNEQELMDKRLIILELFENNTLLFSNQGLNSMVLSNVTLSPNKDESLNRNYYLQAKFELREWPECTVISEETKILSWVLKVFCNDTIAFVKDTQKEDLEKMIRKAWEDKEPGRAEKAKKSRAKYLISLKKTEGNAITEQEQELLNEQRLSKKQREEEINKMQNIKSKSPIKQDKKPNIQGKGKKEEPVLEEKKEKILPEAKNHRLLEVQEFLELMESEKINEEKPLHGGMIDIRSNENKIELKEGFLMGKEEYCGEMVRGFDNREKIKTLLAETKKNFLFENEGKRKVFFEKLAVFLKERDEVKKSLTAKKEKEKKLVDICEISKPNVEELEKILNELSDFKEIDGDLLKYGQKILINAKIMSMIEKLQNAVNVFELNVIQGCLEEISKCNMMIDDELVEKANEIVEEAKTNPNYIQEKQAEFKKAGKKPGKK